MTDNQMQHINVNVRQI